MTRVSIVIPCFNDGEYLLEAITSAEEQDHDDCEIIVVDDGSTDADTRQILDSLGARVRVVRQQNRGLPAARNAGIRASTGEYILPLDADDRLAPWLARRAARILDESPHVGIVGSSTRYFGKASSSVHPRDAHPSEWLIANQLPATAVFRRRDWLECDGYAEDLTWGEDWHFWVKLVSLDRQVALIPEVGFHYRRRVGQMTSTVDWSRQEITRAKVLRDGLPIITRFPAESTALLGSRLTLLEAIRARPSERVRAALVGRLRALRR